MQVRRLETNLLGSRQLTKYWQKNEIFAKSTKIIITLPWEMFLQEVISSLYSIH